MTDYGNIELININETDDFWSLYDELVADKSCFIHNRNTLLEAFKEDRLYGLRIEETDSMFKRRARQDDVFCKNASLYLLPCLCIVNNEHTKIIIIWTHTRARRRGFAKKMVEMITKQECSAPMIPSYPLPDSILFWNACGFLLENKIS